MRMRRRQGGHLMSARKEALLLLIARAHMQQHARMHAFALAAMVVGSVRACWRCASVVLQHPGQHLHHMPRVTGMHFERMLCF